MARNTLPSCFLVLVLFALLGNAYNEVDARQFNPYSIVTTDFCVAQTSAPVDKLQGFIDYVCGVYHCGAIEPIGPCYLPNTLVGHASFVLDLAYKITGTCNTEIGYITPVDPSYESCHYP